MRHPSPSHSLAPPPWEAGERALVFELAPIPEVGSCRRCGRSREQLLEELVRAGDVLSMMADLGERLEGENEKLTSKKTQLEGKLTSVKSELRDLKLVVNELVQRAENRPRRRAALPAAGQTGRPPVQRRQRALPSGAKRSLPPAPSPGSSTRVHELEQALSREKDKSDRVVRYAQALEGRLRSVGEEQSIESDDRKRSSR